MPLNTMAVLSAGLVVATASTAFAAKAAKTPEIKEPAVRVLTAMSTPLKSGHPILFLNGSAGADLKSAEAQLSRLEFPSEQRYSKWSVLFESPLKLEAVEVSTCPGTKPFSDGVELFTDSNDKRFYADGGRNIVRFKLKTTVRALTLNFLESPGLCLDRVSIRSGSDWIRPRVLLASGDAVIADGSFGVAPRALSDGKKTKLIGHRKAGEWKLEWENPLIVEKINLWNGNQNPGDAFTETDRVRDVEVRTDGTKALKVALEDRRDSQSIELKEPHAIQSLELKSLATFPGSIGDEPTIGEVQLLAGGDAWIPVIPVDAAHTDESRESAQAGVIRERGFADILDRELRVTERGDIWKFRFRSDGTFFARIFVDRARVARAWSASGTWRVVSKAEIKSSEPIATPALRTGLRALMKTPPRPEQASGSGAPGLQLTLVGTKVATAEAADSIPCASHCFPQAEERVPTAQREFPILEQIELQRDSRAVFFLRNRTEPTKRTIDFADLKVRIHSLYD